MSKYELKIPIRNIYYMLAYSYGVLKQDAFAMLGQETFDNIYDLLSEILIKGIEIQLKRGLYKEYLPIQEPLAMVRGKIDVNESIKLKARNAMQLYCQYDAFSSNTLLNQILKAVCNLLMKYPKLSKERKSRLKALRGYFQEVEEIPLQAVQWSKLHYHKHNLTYKMLMNICYLIVEGLLVTEETGKNKFPTFIKDEQMAMLYEKFIYAFFKQECPQLEVKYQEQIKWHTDDGYIDLLPTMHSDITLTKGSCKLIIDTKFYSQMMQKNFYSEKKTFISSNLYQIYAYVKNSPFNKVGTVSGMMLYPVIDDTYDEEYRLDGNTIYVRTIDLGKPFEEISEALRKLESLVNITKHEEVYDFAIKWGDKFSATEIDYIELVDHYMADDCAAIGFEMDCGQAFRRIYGQAVNDYEALEEVIDDITDIALLGSAIYSRWRYFNHWVYDAEEVLKIENRTWFVIALRRLAILAEERQEL